MIKLLELVYNSISKESIVASVLFLGVLRLLDYTTDQEQQNTYTIDENNSSNSEYTYSEYSNKTLTFDLDDEEINDEIIENYINSRNIQENPDYILYKSDLDEYIVNLEQNLQELKEKNNQVVNLFEEVKNLKNTIQIIKTKLNID